MASTPELTKEFSDVTHDVISAIVKVAKTYSEWDNPAPPITPNYTEASNHGIAVALTINALYALYAASCYAQGILFNPYTLLSLTATKAAYGKIPEFDGQVAHALTAFRAK